MAGGSFSIPALFCLCLVRIAPVVSVVRLTPSSFSLSWPRPADASELSQYHVTVVESASAEQWKAVVDRTAVSHCFTGLLSGRAYRVALTALYIDGSSMSSGHQDIPKEGGGRGDNGCLAIIPDTGTHLCARLQHIVCGTLLRTALDKHFSMQYLVILAHLYTR